LSKHAKPITPEAEAAARFGTALQEFCRAQDVTVRDLAKITGYSEKWVYKAWGKELAPWELVEKVVKAVCQFHNFHQESIQANLDHWRQAWQAAKAEANEARTSIEARLTRTEERLRFALDRIAVLESENGHPPGVTDSAASDQTLDFRRVVLPQQQGQSSSYADHNLANLQALITEARQETERLRLRAEEAEAYARQLEFLLAKAWDAVNPGAAFPVEPLARPADRPCLPGPPS
jgi:hypothetical protein